MKVLVACECSGRVREAFRKRGHDAWSCDIKPSEDNSTFHFRGDVFDVISKGWDMMIAHPPCTYLSTVGNKWFKTQPERYDKRADAFKFFMALFNSGIPKVCCENPQGHVSSAFRKPDQTIHPFFFGDPYFKRTCLWLKNLPRLKYILEDDLFEKRTATDKPKHVHFDKNGRGKHWCEMAVRLPVAERATERSRTFPGIANAMAEQWGEIKIPVRQVKSNQPNY